MSNALKFFVNGDWVSPVSDRVLDVINPATEEPIGQISVGNAADIDVAVTAARKAFPKWSRSSKKDRLDLLESILKEYRTRFDDIANAITLEMGAPASVSREVQAQMGVTHLETAITVLRDFEFSSDRGTTHIRREPIGVCGLITPWNWPIHQIACKVAPAIAVGCTMVLKPSEIAPLSSIVWAEILAAAGTPPGVFNLVNGDGPNAGAALSSHPEVDMVSFTGSTRAGIEVAKVAAPGIKRVHQELGGKSANILLSDADFDSAVEHCVQAVALNSGQNCNAPTRLLVPFTEFERVEKKAKAVAAAISVGGPQKTAEMGPVVSSAQWNKIQDLIQSGIDEGAKLVCGGIGRPDGISIGYYVKPTIFSRATNDMRISQEEIFGPVLTIIGYENIEQAIEIANDTPYGLAGYVSGKDTDLIRQVSRRISAGQVVVNGASPDPMAPFGGYKQSGNGREWGDFAFHEFLEVKAVLGYPMD